MHRLYNELESREEPRSQRGLRNTQGYQRASLQIKVKRRIDGGSKVCKGSKCRHLKNSFSKE